MKTYFLKQLPLFAHLSKAKLEIIADSIQEKLYLKNEVIFCEKQQADQLLIVFDGFVKIFKSSFAGREHILHVMSKHSIIAEVPIFEGGKYPASCVAMSDSILLAIPRQKLIALIKTDPQVALSMLALQAKRLREFTCKIEELSLKTSKQKFLNFLLQNAHAENGITMVRMKNLNMQELADYLGTARENLSRIINKLIKNNVIKKCQDGFLITSKLKPKKSSWNRSESV